MKIYNIQDAGEFFETLANCNGKVTIVDWNGEEMDYAKNGEFFRNFINSYCQGRIPEIELHFQLGEDLNKLFHYMINRRIAA